MQQPITSFYVDNEGHWVARLACGHSQHVRHDPPLISRPWVNNERGRADKIGAVLDCLKCDQGLARDQPIQA